MKHQTHTITTRHLVGIITSVVFVLILMQTFTIYFITLETQNLENQINTTKKNLEREITQNYQDIQGKINIITDTITSINSGQVDLKEQITEIKASASADFSEVIQKETQGVVTIKTDVSQGTGFIIDSRGFIVTNAHVLSGANYANVFTHNMKKYESQLVGYDLNMDLALLKINGDFYEMKLADSDEVQVGQKVIAIGNPLGLSFTATEGIISAKDRKGINEKPIYFQTDVSLNPGNSGGPLINTKGEVIGINNFKISGAENIGFVLEINPAKKTINKITQGTINQTIV